jgi:dipeptidyl aminopeptidase/acylaminoacyl peptidase
MRFFSRCLVLALVGCAPPNKAKPYPPALPPEDGGTTTKTTDEVAPPRAKTGLVRYFDREIDLEPFLVGFPFGKFHPSLRTNKLFYVALGDKYELRMLDLGEPGKRWDLAGGQRLGDVDWSKRSLWSIHHHAPSDTLWLHADAKNDEEMNLWTLVPKTGALEQVTTHDYVYGFGFSEDDKTLAYIPRHGKAAPFRSCLHVRDVASGDEREVVCDDPKLPFTWSSPRFSPDGRMVYFQAQIKGDRNRVQLVRVDLTAKKPRVETLTDSKARRSELEVLERWAGDDLVYVANDDGFSNLYAFSATTKKTRKLTAFTEDMTSAHLTDRGVVAVHRTPAGSTLVLVDPASGKIAAERRLPGSADVQDGFGTRAVVTQEAPDIVFEAYEIDVGKGELESRDVAALDPSLQGDTVACKASAVKIPTFDKDAKTGKARELHAFVLEPVAPLTDPDEKLALITAFYGGDNSYSEFDQILCAAGFVVVSPSVRGSSGFGRDFQALNDKDLGGDEIVDLFHVARWLEQRTGLSARRIGVYGGSHGGYATMRALTFPPETNGRNELYPFGFGMSHAGFSDIKSFHDACNIPDWVVLESGDPKRPSDLAKMKDRSPISHVQRLQFPLLLTHGSEDWRVPVQESRQFATKAKELKRPVNFVEIAGQGHRIEGLALQVKVMQARFDFLMAVAKAASAGAKR